MSPLCYNRGVRRTVVAVLALCAVVATPRLAAAHQTSVKYIDLVAAGRHVAVTIRVAPGDVTEPLGLPADARPSVDDASTPKVAAYVADWLALSGCTASPPIAKPDEDAKFVAVTWSDECPTTAELTLDFTRFFAVDQRHIAIVRLTAGDEAPVDTIVRNGDPPLVLHAGEAPPSSLLAWIHAGMDHIYSGHDHIAFVLALLLVVMLTRVPGKQLWETRTLPQTVKSTATIITAFTIAHSISLITASLGLVHLPSKFVESMIAASITYTAVEDILKPDVRWRFVLTFGFGLIHGLGFASVLAEMLPPHDVVVPLLCFNLGIEIGQLSIVLIVLPVLFGICRGLTADRYRHALMPMLAVVIAVLGANAIAIRALGVDLLPFLPSWLAF